MAERYTGRMSKSERSLRQLAGDSLFDVREETRIAKRVLMKIKYATIATSDRSSTPWNTPCLCAYDKDYNFYWISARSCRHSENIKANPSVALVFYDSTVPDGRGIGVYIDAVAHVVDDPDEIVKAMRMLYKRAGKKAPPPDTFVNAPRAVYKATPKDFWINDLRKKSEELKYLRLQIDL